MCGNVPQTGDTIREPVRVLSIATAVALACVCAGVARAGSPTWTLAWRTTPNRRYVVPLPKPWRLHVKTASKREIDTWLDPTDRSKKFVVTISRCAACVTKDGKADPRAVIPGRASTTGSSPDTATFVAHVPGDHYTEHGLVIVTRDSAGNITGSLVLQLWMPNVLEPGSENREWSYILANFAAKGTKNG